jgi:hypothetical protein
MFGYREYTVAIEAEGTYGAFATLTNADAGHRLIDPQLEVVSKTIRRPRGDGTLGTGKGAKGPKHTTFKFKNYLHGDGTDGAPGFAAILLPCVGMPSNAADSYQTSSTQANWKGLSAALNRDGRLHVGRGMMGNLKLSAKSGEPVLLDWDMMGGYQADPTDTSQLSGITFEDITPPTFDGSGALTIDGSTGFKISQWAIDLQTQPWLRQDANKAGGYIGGWLTDIAPFITLDPEAEAIATKNWHDAQATGDEMDIVIVVGSAAGNTVTLTLEDCELDERPKPQERNGILVDALGFNVNGPFTIAFA